MFSKFFNLASEKKDRILNAAMKEFAQKGFDNASTNEIVKEANIAKGLLFHYFKDKKTLFLFLYDYAIDISLEEFYKNMDLEEKDFFVRLRQLNKIKLTLLNQYPELFRFLETAYIEQSSKVKKEIDKRNEELTEVNISKVFNGIDITKFKEGLDIKRVINIIMWTLQSYGEEVLKSHKLLNNKDIDYDPIFEEAEEYIKIFKKSFYKVEWLIIDKSSNDLY